MRQDWTGGHATTPAAELRTIPAPPWYRFQRLVEESAATLIALTPFALIAPADARVTLRSHFGLEAVEADQVKLTMGMDFEVEESRTSSEEEPLRKMA